jgi:hypothetical protein
MHLTSWIILAATTALSYSQPTGIHEIFTVELAPEETRHVTEGGKLALRRYVNGHPHL